MSRFKAIIIIVLVVILGVIGVGLIANTVLADQGKVESIITTAKLEKIIDISELSTFQAIYNGVAKVMDHNDPVKESYFVSYEATVDAGINFDDIEIYHRPENQEVVVYLPKVEIKDVNVNIETLEFIFMDQSANKSTVIQEAYKACISDVKAESKMETDILSIADLNAKNIIEALVSPFIKEFNPDYTLVIKGAIND